MNAQIEKLILEMGKVIKGKNDVMVKIITAILASGHILLEDNPGLGKTTLAKTLSKATSLDQKRIQFTPDTMPSDIVGYSVFNQQLNQMKFDKGPVFTNLLLADEINRTSSKTQAAMLEAMAEGMVTVDNQSYDLPVPFITIATQNPITSGGTQALPDSQLDRFMVKLSMGYPDLRSQVEMIIEDNGEDPINTVNQVLSVDELIAMRKEVAETYISYEVAEYISKLIEETRHHDKIECGISPRGAKAFANMSKANAFLCDRNYVIPEDAINVIRDVFKHRLILTPSARREKNAADSIIEDIMKKVVPPAPMGAKVSKHQERK